MTMSQHRTDLETSEQDHEGGRCPHCEAAARRVTCDTCGDWAWLVDCGHESQPRPIAALDHRTYCDECAAATRGT
jgi:hypothetical protein